MRDDPRGTHRKCVCFCTICVLIHTPVINTSSLWTHGSYQDGDLRCSENPKIEEKNPKHGRLTDA